MSTPSPDTHKSTTSGAGDMTLALVPQTPTRTLVRLTDREGDVVLIDPFDVSTVTRSPGHTNIKLGSRGYAAVRETPTEVNNLLARAGVRIIGTDDVSYDEFVAAFATAAARCPRCHRKVDMCACGDICEGCGNYRDECSDKGICPEPEPYTGAMSEDQG